MARAELRSTQMPNSCFAPPLTEQTLQHYKELVERCEDVEIRDAMMECLRCVAVWWELPESSRIDPERWQTTHKGKLTTYNLQPLDEEYTKEGSTLWSVTPWLRECDSMAALFERINPLGNSELRNAAFHLLWYARELSLDREPLTQDKLV